MSPQFLRALIPAAAGLVLFASSAHSQRPALSGEKARVADEVLADLTKLGELQKAHHGRTKVYAADVRDLNFVPTSGAQVNIAYASMNAWAANATHPVLSPIACYIIISIAEPTGPAAAPFCQEGRPGAATTAPVVTGTAPSGASSTPAPATTAPAPDRPAAATTSPTPRTPQPAASTPRTSPPAAATTPARTPASSRSQPATSRPASTQVASSARSTPTRSEQTMSPSTPAAPLRQPTASSGPADDPDVSFPAGSGLVKDDIPATARALTRATSPGGAVVAQQAENVTAAQFSQKLGEFAQGATAIFMTQPAEMVRIVRDPYESTVEFEARRAAAMAAAQRREQEFFQQNTKTYNVALPVRDVRYDADREVLEFTVDGIGLPITRTLGDDAGAPTLTFTCYSRPVFWCSPETGMTYDAGDLWRVSRATARQHDVLRAPLTLYARFAVGRREDSRTLAISLLSMDLQARGQSVQRWDGSR